MELNHGLRLLSVEPFNFFQHVDMIQSAIGKIIGSLLVTVLGGLILWFFTTHIKRSKDNDLIQTEPTWHSLASWGGEDGDSQAANGFLYATHIKPTSSLL
ncbi:MAG: hypothetical protein JEZ12_14340 [Desulfobacterium sp.]|nr:hypothetical protein [Desulfobacterium sp.]